MITSASNRKIKWVRELVSSGKQRKKEGCFVAEGLRMFKETPAASIREAFYTEGFLKSAGDLKEKLGGINGEVVSDDVFKRISDTVTPQGIMMVVENPVYTVDDIIAGDDKLIVILENLQDPGNLGTILRTAEAAGVGGIIMSHGTTDIFSPKVIRSTMGAIYRMPFVYGDLSEILPKMKNEGYKIHAAALGHDTWYTKADFAGRNGIMIGNEGNGLTDEAIALSTDIVTIPMSGSVESLNAAVSAAVLMYEAKRQRENL